MVEKFPHHQCVCHMTNLDEIKDQFREHLNEIITTVPIDDKLINI